MEQEKRRVRRLEKRHQRQVKKHELQVRIQKLREAVFGRLQLSLIARVIWGCAVEKLARTGEGKKHKKLTLEERQRIYLLKSFGYGVREIARDVHRSASTISRELRRNKPLRVLHGLDSYSRAKQAHDIALARHQRTRRRIRLKSIEIQGIVYENIKAGHSPEFISARLLMDYGVSLSHEAIYRWIYDVERVLIAYLTRKGKRYRRGGKKRSRALLQPAAPKLSIEHRSRAANMRLEFGHWEVDTVVSKQSNTCLLVLQERVSRFFFVIKLPCCTVEEASRAVIRLLSPLGKEWVKSLTCDNGPENWGHETISKELGIPVYFCHPYCASERGGIENRNGVLRRFFPKKTNFELVTDAELERVYQHLLHRPMRCLGYFTPYEIFHGTFEPILKMAA